ncbi:type IV conjugative transfer system coupling protein TraD [Chitinimonas koreensis]|uniref:type IV conjugative transfer system coupling protein TraD n=1 Tax=Chitinimonas koreensis TaxID=356302 RepID=UPI000429AE58|nr:type IV conjugative transfer system coupling protein TraD [Chitinimonas koreensis]
MLDNPFRPPFEFYSTAAAVAGAGALLTHPGLAPSIPSLIGATAALGVVALHRGRQGWRIHRSRRNLRRLSSYVVTADEIPRARQHLFLGKGFRWLPRHTERLHLARQPAYDHLRLDSKLYKAARRIERESDGKHWLCKYTTRLAWWNPVAPLPPVGGDPAIHGIELDEEDIWQATDERVGHTLVLGTTRVGKTRLAELLISQDIARGEIVIVFDPKGDADLLKRMYAEAVRAGREKDFYMFHLGYPELSARYNPVGNFGKITEVATRTAGPLPSEGQSATFRQFVWRFVNVMARAMALLGLKPSYKAIYQHAVNIDALCLQYFEFWLDRDRPDWRKELDQFNVDGKTLQEKCRKTGRTDTTVKLLMYIQEQALQDDVGTALMSVLSNDRTYFEKLVSSLFPLLEKLTTGDIAGLLSPDYDDASDSRPIFDWAKVFDQKAIVYFGLDALTDYEVAGAVGNAAFADLTSLAGKIYKHGQAYGQRQANPPTKAAMHFDEFNELIGDEFIPMVNKAGGAGFQVTAYTQTWSDVEAKIGNAAKAGQIAGNFNSLIMLRVKNTETAELLTDQLPKVRIRQVTPDSSANDIGDPGDATTFKSSNKDSVSTVEVDMVQPSDLVQLPKGQAFALINGGQLYKIRMPLASAANDPAMPANLQAMANSMREKYNAAINDDEVDVQGLGAGW